MQRKTNNLIKEITHIRENNGKKVKKTLAKLKNHCLVLEGKKTSIVLYKLYGI